MDTHAEIETAPVRLEIAIGNSSHPDSTRVMHRHRQVEACAGEEANVQKATYSLAQTPLAAERQWHGSEIERSSGSRGADSGGRAKKAKTAAKEVEAKQTSRNIAFIELRNDDIGDKQLSDKETAEMLPAKVVDASSERDGKQETVRRGAFSGGSAKKAKTAENEDVSK